MDKADNYKGVEVCASDIGLSDLMVDIADLKAGIDTISEELYKIILEINNMCDWEGNGKDATLRVLKILLSYSSVLSGKSSSLLVDNYVKTSGLTINGAADLDHFEQLTNAISEFSSAINGFEGASTPVKELLAL